MATEDNDIRDQEVWTGVSRHWYSQAPADDIRDREVWTGVSRHWCSGASDKAPITGRLHHHLAILARPNLATDNLITRRAWRTTVPQTSSSFRIPYILVSGDGTLSYIIVHPSLKLSTPHAVTSAMQC